jgi:aryl-alcohol dehydrogenase-like predicted oxidoreductase
MRYRKFGTTGLDVSEVGFGSWGIGGQAYGAVEEAESLRALAVAEELGCNFVDTALVYGDAERVLGKFMQGRRSCWVAATKFSGQPEGMTTLERQRINLQTDVIDFYQLHWMPRGKEEPLFDELSKLKRSGKGVPGAIEFWRSAEGTSDHQQSSTYRTTSGAPRTRRLLVTLVAQSRNRVGSYFRCGQSRWRTSAGHFCVSKP